MPDFKSVLKQAKKLPPTDARLLLTAFISGRLEVEKPFVVVGGFSDEFYTGGEYRTGDVDIAIDSTKLIKELEKALRELGFKLRSGVWIHREAGYALEFLFGEKPGRPKMLKVGPLNVWIQSPEEAVVNDLANVALYGEIYRDRAVMVYQAMRGRFDEVYARKLARERGPDVEKMLENITSPKHGRTTSK